VVEIVHEPGRKDKYRVTVRFEKPVTKWAPNLEHLFRLVDLWFESENRAYGGNFGRDFVNFFIDLIYIGHPEEAIKAAQLRGWESRRHFEEMVRMYGEEVIERTKKLIEKVKKLSFGR